MARVNKRQGSGEPIHIGRVLALLRESLDWTQSDLARRSGVKRASISEYESEKSTPDVGTLERLLSAMGFRWIALDFGLWFVDWLLTYCRIPDAEDPRENAPSPVTVSALATQLRAWLLPLRNNRTIRSVATIISQRLSLVTEANALANTYTPVVNPRPLRIASYF